VGDRVGADFRFGRDRIGDVALLSAEGSVTASGLRGADVRRAALEFERRARGPRRRRRRFGERDTGRPSCCAGASSTVTRAGRARLRDRQPRYEAFQVVPLEGIYAGAARTPIARGAGGDLYWHAPQFYENGPLLVEVHLPGFEGDLYDASLDVAFLARLRGEEVFPTWTRWCQIGRDVQQTVELFKKFSEFTSALLE